MRQLITRIDDDLHRRLKERAKAEGRSVNSLVAALIRAAVSGSTERERVRARLMLEGKLVVPPMPKSVPTLDEIEEMTRGWGPIVSEILLEDRRSR